MKYTTVLFDLDGTITDSKPGILNSIRYALKKYGLQVPSDEVLQTFIGPPLKEQFQEVFGLTEEESIQMVAAYREYYAEKGIFENRVYEGVRNAGETEESWDADCYGNSKARAVRRKNRRTFRV